MNNSLLEVKEVTKICGIIIEDEYGKKNTGAY